MRTAVCRSASIAKLFPSIGSKTCAVVLPPALLRSRRVRSYPSRAIDARVCLRMRLPSVKVCTVSLTASAEYGAFFTISVRPPSSLCSNATVPGSISMSRS